MLEKESVSELEIQLKLVVGLEIVVSGETD
jgi:hypothetical protein